MNWKIKFYKDDKENFPVKDFLLTLSHKEQAKAVWTIELLEITGINLTEPYAKHIEASIWELRSHNNRILYFLIDKTFVLLHGFKKKTNKLPLREKEIAFKRMEDHLERRGKNV